MLVQLTTGMIIASSSYDDPDEEERTNECRTFIVVYCGKQDPKIHRSVVTIMYMIINKTSEQKA